MRLRGPLSILGALLFGGAAAIFSGEASADDASLRDAVELTAAAMWYNYKSPGLVLAVVRGDDTVVLGFGETAKGSKLEPNGRTMLRIGSISKAFAGELLASLAAEGKLRARRSGGEILKQRCPARGRRSADHPHRSRDAFGRPSAGFAR
jgi:CubicO group peptidase (beta-lactamase class C family)